MKIVILTALGVGGATIIGALIGFLMKNISHRFSDYILSFAGGIMLAAAVMGLVVPSLEYGSIITTITGIFLGALIINMLDKLIPHIHRLSGMNIENQHGENTKINKVILFVMAIAIHNLPEGIAAGVGFGTGNVSDALTIAIGIALQNIPEGVVIIGPMLALGMSRGRAFLLASVTGIVEVIGTFVGYFLVSFSTAVLPFALAFAGGTMLYVISDEMIPETHHEGNPSTTYSLLIGFCFMLFIDHVL